MYVDPYRLLFMFDEPILIFYINGFVLKWRRTYEKYRNPALFDRKSGVTTGYPALRLDAVKYGKTLQIFFS